MSARNDRLTISLGPNAAERKAALLRLAEQLEFTRRRGKGYSISQLIIAIADKVDRCPEFEAAMDTAINIETEDC